MTDQELLKRLTEICEKEGVSGMIANNTLCRALLANLLFIQQVKYSSEGLAAIIFTAEGDMRQAINNLQSTHSGFGFVSAEAVFKVCDLPHPVTINKMISACEKGDIDNAMEALGELWSQGYSAVDIVSTIFRVVKNNESMPEYRKLEFIKVSERTRVGRMSREL